jgi:acetyl-CoA carboxylase biotin carboxyl carrier protein
VYLTSEDVQDILHLLDTLPFGELHLRTESFHLSVRRAADGEWTQTTQVLVPPRIEAPAVASTGDRPPASPAAAPTATAPTATAPTATTPTATTPTAATAAGRGDRLIEVRTPLPGTFYRAPRPGSPPFVEVRSEVDTDTVVGIIETMKLMNSVYAGARGTVAELCVADAGFAGQGTVLMRIDPGPA